MTSNPELSEPKRPPILVERSIPTFSISGMFWLEPTALMSTLKRIDGSRYGTMYIGAATHRVEFEEALGEIANKHIPEENEQFDELRLALKFGYMFGRFAATSTNELVYDDMSYHEVDRVYDVRAAFFRRDIAHLIYNHKDTDGSNQGSLFLHLRRLEILLGGSDILAYSLARSQAHLADEFQRYREVALNLISHNQTNETMPGNSLAEREHLQAMFYAGALIAAANHTSEGQRRKPDCVIMRSATEDEGLVGHRPIESDPDLLDTDIERALSQQLEFGVIDLNGVGDKPDAIIVARGAFQSDPQTASSPSEMFADESPSIVKIPFEGLLGIVARCDDPNLGAVFRIYDPLYYRDYVATIESHVIQAVIGHGGVLSGYDYNHPAAKEIRSMAAYVLQRDENEIGYSSRIASLPVERRLG